MAKESYSKEVTPEQLLKMTYMKLLDLEVKFDLLDATVESLRQDVSKNPLCVAS